MIWAVVAVVVVVVGALLTLALLLNKSKSDQLAMRDRIEKLDEALDELERDRDGFKVERDGAREELRKERDLRAAVESERNDAYRRARDYYAARIKAAGVADAVRLVDDLFRLPLPGVVSETVPAGDPARTDDDLLKPPGM